MVEHEQRVALAFTVVLRLRFDGTPAGAIWERARMCRLASSGASVFAITDHLICGGRRQMESVAQVFDAIFTHFAGHGRWAALPTKPFGVSAALDSALASHPCSFSGMRSAGERFYTKLAQLPLLPQVDSVPARSMMNAEQPRRGAVEAQQQLVKGLQQAQQAGIEYIDASVPRSASASIAATLVSTDHWPPNRTHTEQSNLGFSTERDFVAWLLASNISVKELSILTQSSAYLFKGELWPRPPPPGQVGGSTACAISSHRVHLDLGDTTLDGTKAPWSS